MISADSTTTSTFDRKETTHLLKQVVGFFEGEGTFRAVDLRCLQPDEKAPCDLFLRAGQDRFTLFVRKGAGFEGSTRRRLHVHGVTHLFIREEEAGVFYDRLRNALIRIVKDPCCPDRTKAEFIHSACKDIISQVYGDPRAPFLIHACEIITPAVDLVVANERATRCLVQLTAHDLSTYTHSTNVGIFAVALARIVYGQSVEHDLRKMAMGFFLHDLGKCHIPLEILNKPGSLNDREWHLMRAHPKSGYEILSQTGFMSDEAKLIILEHHERDDGTGYPGSLKSHEIHPYARICRLADVYEALTSDRAYHKRRSTFQALKLMKEKVLVDMDSEFFECFVRLFEKT